MQFSHQVFKRRTAITKESRYVHETRIADEPRQRMRNNNHGLTVRNFAGNSTCDCGETLSLVASTPGFFLAKYSAMASSPEIECRFNQRSAQGLYST